MITHKKGDTVKITDSIGNVIEAIFLKLDYRKDPKHYMVEIKKPTSFHKSGYRKQIWFIPESRFVKK